MLTISDAAKRLRRIFNYLYIKQFANFSYLIDPGRMSEIVNRKTCSNPPPCVSVPTAPIAPDLRCFIKKIKERIWRHTQRASLNIDKHGIRTTIPYCVTSGDKSKSLSYDLVPLFNTCQKQCNMQGGCPSARSDREFSPGCVNQLIFKFINIRAN